jgi:hypothetical protein
MEKRMSLRLAIAGGFLASLVGLVVLELLTLGAVSGDMPMAIGLHILTWVGVTRLLREGLSRKGVERQPVTGGARVG